MKTSVIKEQFILDYLLKSSVKILFSRLSTPIGLSEWFADDVVLQDDILIFSWNKYSQKARIIGMKDSQYIRFQWIENNSDVESSESEYFEFKIYQDDLTGDVHLTITDHATLDEIDDAKELWDTQINDLKRLLGA